MALGPCAFGSVTSGTSPAAACSKAVFPTRLWLQS
jgi:hypothetical protein